MASEDVCCVYMTLKFNALDTSKCYRGIKTIKRDKCSFLFNAPGLLPSFCYYKQMKNYQEQETSLHYLANIQLNIKGYLIKIVVLYFLLLLQDVKCHGQTLLGN